MSCRNFRRYRSLSARTQKIVGSQLKKSVASVEAQTSPPIEIIVCIDHNEELLRKSEEYFGKERPVGTMPLIVAGK